MLWGIKGNVCKAVSIYLTGILVKLIGDPLSRDEWVNERSEAPPVGSQRSHHNLRVGDCYQQIPTDEIISSAGMLRLFGRSLTRYRGRCGVEITTPDVHLLRVFEAMLLLSCRTVKPQHSSGDIVNAGPSLQRLSPIVSFVVTRFQILAGKPSVRVLRRNGDSTSRSRSTSGSPDLRVQQLYYVAGIHHPDQSLGARFLLHLSRTDWCHKRQHLGMIIPVVSVNGRKHDEKFAGMKTSWGDCTMVHAPSNLLEPPVFPPSFHSCSCSTPPLRIANKAMLLGDTFNSYNQFHVLDIVFEFAERQIQLDSHGHYQLILLRKHRALKNDALVSSNNERGFMPQSRVTQLCFFYAGNRELLGLLAPHHQSFATLTAALATNLECDTTCVDEKHREWTSAMAKSNCRGEHGSGPSDDHSFKRPPPAPPAAWPAPLWDQFIGTSIIVRSAFTKDSPKS
ncbi:hypothetical protein HYFRA_00004029 [Hymenoscyphus fraxineus]|uniref:Uncharacterized protein n=1 Tax=Hymenoscyphus fraxineus TaxID=746836 RepID=A0A9N9KMI8_9HELO|nr:hypothetical protein HYFRA_00004029 [Hymenoscyphus fraxineus]